MTTPKTARKADHLLATLVQANVDSLASTTDAIIDNLERQISFLAEGLHTLAAGIERIPEMSRTAYLDGLLTDNWAAIATARRTLCTGRR